MRRWTLGVALLGALGAGALLLWLGLQAQSTPDEARGGQAPARAEGSSQASAQLPQEPAQGEAQGEGAAGTSERFLQITPAPRVSEAERRLGDLWPRYRSHLAYLKLEPEHILNTTALAQIIAEQSALMRELEAVAELADPQQTNRAITQGAELEEAFAGWLEAVAALSEDEALSKQLDSLSEMHYASAEKGFSLAEELSKE